MLMGLNDEMARTHQSGTVGIPRPAIALLTRLLER